MAKSRSVSHRTLPTGGAVLRCQYVVIAHDGHLANQPFVSQWQSFIPPSHCHPPVRRHDREMKGKSDPRQRQVMVMVFALMNGCTPLMGAWLPRLGDPYSTARCRPLRRPNGRGCLTHGTWTESGDVQTWIKHQT